MDKKIPDRSKSVSHFLENVPLSLSKDFLNLDFSEHTLLPNTLFLQGEYLLSQGQLIEALYLFDESLELAVDRASLYYRQGTALFSYGQAPGKEKALLIANKKFKEATLLTPDSFGCWHMWGQSLAFLGTTFQEKHYFIEAEKKLQRALSLSNQEEQSILWKLHSEIAGVLSYLANSSKEPLDWHLAIEHFQKAVSYSDSFPPVFWDSYGKACLQLSSCINDIRLCVKAIHFFKYALSRSPSTFPIGWKHLAKALWDLYEHTHDEEHFTQATDCFAAALQTNANDVDLWLDCAKLFLDHGRRVQNSKHLKSSIDKSVKAYSLNIQSAKALAIWGESLALVGEYGDRLDLLLEGENKLTQALDIDPEEISITYSYGQCLNSLGNYYQDSDYHYQAIEKFQEGVSKDRTLHTNWHGIGMSYFTIGFAEQNEYILAKALWFFHKAMEIAPHNTYYQVDLAICLSRLGEFFQTPQYLEESIEQFEKALQLQKNAVYLHPEWLLHYARTLDLYGDHHEETVYYTKALELLSHALMMNPELDEVHYQMGLSFSHLGELTLEINNFYKALHYFKLAAKQDEENDSILLDLGITLINISECTSDLAEVDTCLADAEVKLTQSAKSGNLTAYYQLACLYSLTGRYEEGLRFLKKADTFDALPYLEEILEDDWLEALRNTSECREFLLILEKKASLQQ